MKNTCKQNEINSITDIGVSFCGSVELGNLLDVEALDKLLPDLRPESVAEHETDFVIPLLGTGRRGEQIATRLANVLGNLVSLIKRKKQLISESKERQQSACSRKSKLGSYEACCLDMHKVSKKRGRTQRKQIIRDPSALHRNSALRKLIRSK